MYHPEGRTLRILSVAGTIVGLVTGLITVYVFIQSEGRLLGWFSSESMDAVAASAQRFAERWSYGPFLTTLLVYGVVAAIAFASDRVEGPEYVGTLLFLLPLPAIWIWLFADLVSGRGLLLFVLGYAAVPWLTVFIPIALAEMMSERLERRDAIVGTVRDVKETKRRFLDVETTHYSLIVERAGDIPVKVTYQPWSSRTRLEVAVGDSVEVLGRWHRGEFLARRIDVREPTRKLRATRKRGESPSA